MLSEDDVKAALPAHLRSAVTPELVDKVNAINEDPEVGRAIRDNFITYTRVMTEGQFKAEDYINAVTYVSFKLMGMSNQEAYARTFPDRMARLDAARASGKEISSYVSHYNRNQLVNRIMEQSMIPIWVLNQGAVQEAINTQLILMRTSPSDKVRAEAANSILTHLKPPEKKQVSIDFNLPEERGINALKEQIAELARAQRDAIQSGVQTRQIAQQVLIPKTIEDAEMVDVTPPAP